MRRMLVRTYVVVTLLALAATAGGQWVEDSIDVGGWNAASLVYNSRAGVVYGRCLYEGYFFAIDCSTNQVISQIPLWSPNSVAYDSADNKAYCTFLSHGEDSVLVVDGEDHTRLKAISLPGATEPLWDAVGNKLYITCWLEDHVAVLDCPTDSVVRYIRTPGEPVGLTVNSRHRKLYVSNDVNESVSVIDMEADSVIRNVHVGNYQFAACYSAVADKYYCNGSEGVAVIDGVGDTLIKHIALPSGYRAMAIVSVEPESLVMVAAYSGAADSVFMLDVTQDSIVSALPVGSSPEALVYSPVTHYVYCANAGWDNLSVIAADGSRVVKQVSVGNYPLALLLCAGTGKLYVGHSRQWVYVVRDRTGGVAEGPDHATREWKLTASPNPFTASVQLELKAPAAGSQVTVYSQTGQVVRRLVREAGRHVRSVWDGTDERGSEVPAGVYFAVAEGAAGGRVRVVKMK